MQLGKTSTAIGGIDIGKCWLDAAVHGSAETLRAPRTDEGIARLGEWLCERGVVRVGMEASGGYEQIVVRGLQSAGFETVLHQAIEVRLFARLKRLKAKNDKLDAALIAAATAQVDTVKAAADPRLAELAERLTAYEQVCDLTAKARVFLEHVTLKDLLRDLKAQIAALSRLKAKLMAEILRRLRLHADLARRLELVMSLPGIGPVSAASFVIRMPELGSMNRGQAAALIGVAPYDRDSGQHKGQRSIAGGRRRPRRLLYMAALAARRGRNSFAIQAKALAERGKPPKVILVAVMRRLIEAANLVLARGQPWTATA